MTEGPEASEAAAVGSWCHQHHGHRRHGCRLCLSVTSSLDVAVTASPRRQTAMHSRGSLLVDCGDYGGRRTPWHRQCHDIGNDDDGEKGVQGERQI